MPRGIDLLTRDAVVSAPLLGAHVEVWWRRERAYVLRDGEVVRNPEVDAEWFAGGIFWFRVDGRWVGPMVWEDPP